MTFTRRIEPNLRVVLGEAMTVRKNQSGVGARPRRYFAYNGFRSIDNIEVEALTLSAPACARLAEKLLESLERLSPDENQQVWAEEAAG